MTKTMENEPRKIAGDLLIRTRNALTSGDYDAFGECFCIPFTLFTDIGETRVLSHRQNREIFERVRWHYRALSVTELRRDLLTAQFFGDDVILSVHEARLLRDGKLVQEPFKVLSTLNKCDGAWKISDNRYAVSGSRRFNRALYGPKPVITARQADPQEAAELLHIVPPDRGSVSDTVREN